LSEIAHFISYTGTAMGGPVQSMAAYVGLLAEAGYLVTVYSASQQTDGISVRLNSRVRHVQKAGRVGRLPPLFRVVAPGAAG